MDTQTVTTLVAAIVALGLPTGVAWYFKSLRDDRLSEKANYEKVINDLRADNKALLQARLDDQAKRLEAADVTNKTLGDMMTLLRQQKGLVS